LTIREYLLRDTNGLTLKFIFDHIVNIGVAYIVVISGKLFLSERTSPYPNVNQDNVLTIGYFLIGFGVLLGIANALQFFFVAHKEAIGRTRFVFILILYLAIAIPIILGIGIAVFNMINGRGA